MRADSSFPAGWLKKCGSRERTSTFDFVTVMRRASSLLWLRGLLLFAALCPMATRPVAGEEAKLVHTAALNRDADVRAAYDRFYILDYAGALERFQKISAAQPDDPIATDYVLDATLFAELYRLNLLDTTLYAHDGFLSNRHPVEENKQVTAEIFALTDKVMDQSDALLKKNSKDVDALFARGWARSMKATYIGLVQHSFIAALLALALQSRGDDEKVLSIDPNNVDADLVVGVHQYVAGSLPLAFKMMAGLVGEGGSKQKGLALLREAKPVWRDYFG